MTVCPLEAIGFGTWQKIEPGYYLRSQYGDEQLGQILEGGAPEISGKIDLGDGVPLQIRAGDGCIQGWAQERIWSAGSYWKGNGWSPGIKASNSSAVYGRSGTIRPPSYVVNIWRRIA